MQKFQSTLVLHKKHSNGFNEKLQLNSVNLKYQKFTSPLIYANVLVKVIKIVFEPGRTHMAVFPI